MFASYMFMKLRYWLPEQMGLENHEHTAAICSTETYTGLKRLIRRERVGPEVGSGSTEGVCWEILTLDT